MAIKKGKRTTAKLRIGLTGPTNGGKTYSSIRLAYGILKETHPEWTEEEIWDHIVLIDTERMRGLFYINRTDLPLKTGEFYHVSISAPYHPQKYIDAIKEAEDLLKQDGVIIIDSLSHAWNYSGGILDIKEQISKKPGVNSYTAWNEAGQIQNNLIDIILSTECHTIVTMRSKMEYVLEQNENGKLVPIKKGLSPIQRDDVEYEFDITLMLDKDHKVTIIKDITFLNQITYENVIDENLGSDLIKWLIKDLNIDDYNKNKTLEYIEKIKEIITNVTEARQYYEEHYFKEQNLKLSSLTLDQAKEIYKDLKEIK